MIHSQISWPRSGDCGGDGFEPGTAASSVWCRPVALLTEPPHPRKPPHPRLNFGWSPMSQIQRSVPGSLDKKCGRKIPSMFHLCLIKVCTVLPLFLSYEPGIELCQGEEKGRDILILCTRTSAVCMWHT
jgi:hypothetical protein